MHDVETSERNGSGEASLITLYNKLVSVPVIAKGFQGVPSTMLVVRVVDFVWRLRGWRAFLPCESESSRTSMSRSLALTFHHFHLSRRSHILHTVPSGYGVVVHGALCASSS